MSKSKLITPLAEVSLDDLGSGVYWAGDNLGLGSGPEIIVIRDEQGSTTYATSVELLAHPVWNQLGDYCKKRIKGGLEAALPHCYH